ncbi:DNA integrity scanning protein DisA nucleotide-binding domain protein [Desulfobacula sp.]|uniref:DNA integrity scanning protein DisA nucleotide-binding domain protein n=1 Tax=Desulfobacula sp. TaxID=2593537 RepID=UPI00263A01BE|nr:DNA integrity scanning protein DisA nucleotide-binding domain protein [Desulfobacula sp.]
MDECTFAHTCIVETAEGLRAGLSHFSGPSRTAVIYSIKPDDPMQIFDPQGLLTGHEPKFKELYIDADKWRGKTPFAYDKKKFSNLITEKNLELAGLISYGGRSSSVVYQMWFTEHHPDMCSIGPTERWLEQAVWRLSHDIANEQDLYTGISGSFLKEYATHAVRDYLVDEMNVLIGWDTQIRIYPILEAVLKISRTPEERAWPIGELIFVEKQSLPKMTFIAKFPKAEQPELENIEHIRKLLQSVENSDRKLVSDERTIIGIIKGEKPEFSISADFKGRYGFLKLNNKTICSFSDGSFKSTTRKAKLVQVEEALLESDMDPAAASAFFKIIVSIVHSAAKQRHGCSIVIDLNETPIFISGHSLEQPIELKKREGLELTKSLSKVDGALHLGADLRLHGFACLLDGHFIPGENRARGARFNSALRFTAEHKNIIVIVVSSDDPVSIMIDGEAVNTNTQCKFSSLYNDPLLLEQWVTISKTS